MNTNSNLGKKKVLICGASGFVGKNIASRLAKNPEYDVTGVYFRHEPKPIEGVKYVKADLTERNAVNEITKGVDILLHHAAIATNFKDVITKPYIHTTDNVVMTSFLIRAAHENKVSQFVFSSCGYLYNDGEHAFKEEEAKNINLPKGYFGAAWSKLYLEKMCEFYAGLGTTKFTVMRQANIYGPGDKLDLDTAHALPATIIKAISSKDGKIEVWGDGSQLRDLIYVDDFMDFIETAIRYKSAPGADAYDFVNVGSGNFYSMREIAENVVAAGGNQVKIEYNTSKPSAPIKWRLDSTLAKQKFGWAAKMNLREGIQKTYDWYRSVL